MSNLLRRIERLLRRDKRLTATTIGRAALRDPCLVRELRNGRCLRPRTAATLEAWIEAAERADAAGGCAK